MSTIVAPTNPDIINPLPDGGFDIQGIEDQENRLAGSEDSDQIIGGNLNDIFTLTGGAGSDIFQFNFASETDSESDTTETPSIEELGIEISEITDFQPGEDQITIQGLGGTEAPIYNSDTGVLSLDDIEIAQLATDLNISADDIEIAGNNNPLSVVNNSEATVYRFFNPDVGVHFYTASEAERDNVEENLPNFEFEGESYTTVDPTTGGQEVYRFFNSTTGVHLYTTNEVERDSIIENLPDFQFEGVQFYAYETEVEGSIPVYRFFERTLGVHFYTPSEAERDNVQANLPNYNFEGIAYYALPLDVSDV